MNNNSYIKKKKKKTERKFMKIQETFICSEHRFTFVFVCYQNQARAVPQDK